MSIFDLQNIDEHTVLKESEFFKDWVNKSARYLTTSDDFDIDEDTLIYNQRNSFGINSQLDPTKYLRINSMIFPNSTIVIEELCESKEYFEYIECDQLSLLGKISPHIIHSLKCEYMIVKSPDFPNMKTIDVNTCHIYDAKHLKLFRQCEFCKINNLRITTKHFERIIKWFGGGKSSNALQCNDLSVQELLCLPSKHLIQKISIEGPKDLIINFVLTNGGRSCETKDGYTIFMYHNHHSIHSSAPRYAANFLNITLNTKF